MSAYDWNLSAGAPLCTFSDSFYRTVRETIFQQITRDTTPEQFQEAVASLTRLRDELVQAMRPMHYGALIGRQRKPQTGSRPAFQRTADGKTRHTQNCARRRKPTPTQPLTIMSAPCLPFSLPILIRRSPASTRGWE